MKDEIDVQLKAKVMRFKLKQFNLKSIVLTLKDPAVYNDIDSISVIMYDISGHGWFPAKKK